MESSTVESCHFPPALGQSILLVRAGTIATQLTVIPGSHPGIVRKAASSTGANIENELRFGGEASPGSIVKH